MSFQDLRKNVISASAGLFVPITILLSCCYYNVVPFSGVMFSYSDGLHLEEL